jgi:hypothetical protein
MGGLSALAKNRGAFNTRFSATIALALFVFSSSALAGPSPEDIDYSPIRPLRVMTKVSNNIRFDIIIPEAPYELVAGGVEASYYSDEILIVRQIDSGKILYSRQLKSASVKFIGADKLAENYVVMREWSGGASCCLLITAFQTSPEFKIILEHNNDFFDMTEIVAGPEKLELFRSDENTPYPASHSALRYVPSYFDLSQGKWE